MTAGGSPLRNEFHIDLSDPVFPQDIFDIILDNLRDDPSSLKACATACRAFWLPCRRLLFYRVVLDTKSTKKSIHATEWSPDIAACVREVHIAGDDIDLHIESRLSAVLLTFVNLQKFRWRAFRDNGYLVLVWKWLDSGFKETLQTIFSMPTLTHVDLSGIGGFPVSYFHLLQNQVRYLKLDSMTFDRVQPPPLPIITTQTNKEAHKIRLNFLCLATLSKDAIDYLFGLESPFDYSGLSAFTAVEAHAATSLGLISCPETLQHYGQVFWRHLGGDIYLSDLQRDIARLRDLRSLAFLPAFSHSGLDISTTPSSIMLRTLETLHSSPYCVIEEVTIVLQQKSFDHFPSGSLETWKKIDDILTQLSRKTLRKVHVLVLLTYTPEYSQDDLKADLDKLLPTSLKQDIISAGIRQDGSELGSFYWTTVYALVSAFDRRYLYL